MVKVNGTTMLITRGDSAYIEFNIVDDSNVKYVFDEYTKIHIQVRSLENDDLDTGLLIDAETETEIDENDVAHYLWHIVPADTAKSRADQDYVWDAQIEFADGDVYTFIESSKFKIKPEVTLRKINEETNPPQTVSTLKDLTKTVITVTIPKEG